MIPTTCTASLCSWSSVKCWLTGEDGTAMEIGDFAFHSLLSIQGWLEYANVGWACRGYPMKVSKRYAYTNIIHGHDVKSGGQLDPPMSMT